MKIAVAIVEDDRNYNESLKRLINAQEDMYCCAQFFYGKQAQKELPDYEPDVVLMDIQLQDMLGIDVIKKVFPLIPKSRFVMSTTFEDEQKIFDSLRAGALGYLLKGENIFNILYSIREVYNGGSPMSQKVARKVIKFFKEQADKKYELNELTPAENEVLELLAQGLQYKEIADKKFVTKDTVKKQISSIYKKLQVSNKVEAVIKYNNLKNNIL